MNWLGYGDSPIYVFDRSRAGRAIPVLSGRAGGAGARSAPVELKDLPKENHLRRCRDLTAGDRRFGLRWRRAVRLDALLSADACSRGSRWRAGNGRFHRPRVGRRIPAADLAGKGKLSRTWRALISTPRAPDCCRAGDAPRGWGPRRTSAARSATATARTSWPTTTTIVTPSTAPSPAQQRPMTRFDLAQQLARRKAADFSDHWRLQDGAGQRRQAVLHPMSPLLDANQSRFSSPATSPRYSRRQWRRTNRCIISFYPRFPDLAERHRAIVQTIERSERRLRQDRLYPRRDFRDVLDRADRRLSGRDDALDRGQFAGAVAAKFCAAGNQKVLIARPRWANLCHQLLSAGIAHGDLKHDNVLVTADGKFADRLRFHVRAVA